MNLQQFSATRQADWTELHDLVAAASGRPERIGSAAMLRAGRLYRSAAADLAYAQRRFPGDPVTVNLGALVQRARALVYSSVTTREGVWWFLHTGFWRRVRERRGALLLAAGLMIATTVGGGLWAHQNPVQAMRVMPSFAAASGQRAPDADKHLSLDTSTGMSTMIFTNNIRVAVVAFVGGLSLGLLTGWVVLFNGLVLGLLGGAEVANGNGSVFVQLVIPHGLLELSLFVVAGAGGFRVADALLRPGTRKRSEALAGESRAAVEMVLGCAAWLVPCGIVEGFVTPAGLGLAPNVTIGVTLFVLFWGLVAWRGRRPGDDARVPGATPAPVP